MTTPAALQLLLRLLEAKELVYTYNALAGFHGKPGEELIASGLLAEADYEHGARDDDDDGAFVEVDGDAYQEGLGLHSRISGFVRVEKLTLLRYAPRIEDLFRLLLGDQLRALTGGPKKLDEAGCFWDLGVSRVNKEGLTSVWFGRRLHDLSVRAVLADLTVRFPPATPRLMLTTTPTGVLSRDHHPDIMIISIDELLAGMNPIVIDFALLKARFSNQPVEAIDSPVHLSADQCVLTLNYKVKVRFRKQSKQQVLIVLFVQAYCRGVRLEATEALGKAKSNADSLDQAFGAKWKVLREFLKSRDGLWGFEF